MDMREMLAKRAEAQQATEAKEQTFEAKLARAIAAIDKTLAHRIGALRVIGPPMPGADKRRKDMSVGHCRFCNPEPKVYKCVKCDWETYDHWRMKMHNDLDPKWCRDRAAKKVRVWSRQA